MKSHVCLTNLANNHLDLNNKKDLRLQNKKMTVSKYLWFAEMNIANIYFFD